MRPKTVCGVTTLASILAGSAFLALPTPTDQERGRESRRPRHRRGTEQHNKTWPSPRGVPIGGERLAAIERRNGALTPCKRPLAEAEPPTYMPDKCGNVNYYIAIFVGIMQVKDRCRIPLPIRCRWRFGAAKFRCRQVRQIASKRLIKKYLHVERAPFSRAAKIFSPDVRGKVAGSAQGLEERDHPLPLRCVG